MGDGVVTKVGKNLMIDRAFLAAPVNTAPTLFDVGTSSTTPTEADTALVAGLSLFLSFVAGYPTFDTANKKVTVRCFLDSTQANGNTLREVGIFNSDTPKDMVSRDTHDDIAKTTSIQVAYILEYEMT